MAGDGHGDLWPSQQHALLSTVSSQPTRQETPIRVVAEHIGRI